MARLRIAQISPYGETSHTRKTLYAIGDEKMVDAMKFKKQGG
jgi:hypothetical protein